MAHRLMYFPAVAETYFDLGRVNVDVHCLWRDIEEEHERRMSIEVETA